MEQLFTLTAYELQQLILQKKVSVREVVEAYLSRIDSTDTQVKAFLNVYTESVLSKAKILDDSPVKGKLFGLPIAIKDNICRKGDLTRSASKILEGFRPPYSAHVVEQMENEGALILGKVNMDEFAFGSSCETSAFQVTKNPWDLNRIPGGSSGGSCACVAARQVPFSLGSDTGGSIRQPASLCGVMGLKPTYGRVSRYGLMAFASSLDQIGPIGHDIRDIALLLNVIAGKDDRDSTSIKLDVPDYLANLKNDVKNLVIGIPKEYFVAGLDIEVKDAVHNAVKYFEQQGAKIEEISLPHTEYAVSVYYIIAPSEASSNLARYDGVGYGYRSKDVSGLIDMYKKSRSEGFGEEAKRRIILGTFVLSSGYYDAYYLKAQKVRTLIKQDFDKVFSKCDVIITPTAPTPAFTIGEKMNNPLDMYLSDVFTIPVNLAGLPAISVPCGFSKSKLPIGMHIIGKPFDEQTILNTAYNYQNNTEHHKMFAQLD